MPFKLVSVSAEDQQVDSDDEGSHPCGFAVGAALFEPILSDLRKNVLGE